MPTYIFCRRVAHIHTHTHGAHTRDLANLQVPVTLVSAPIPPSHAPMSCILTPAFSFFFSIFDEPKSNHAHCRRTTKKKKKKKKGLKNLNKDREDMGPFRICIPHANAIPCHVIPTCPSEPSITLAVSVYPLLYFSISTPKSKLPFQPVPFSNVLVFLSPVRFHAKKFQMPKRTPTHKTATRFSLQLGEFNPPAEGAKGKAKSVNRRERGGGKKKGKRMNPLDLDYAGFGYLTI